MGSLPPFDGPIAVSNNFCSFQKGSGVSPTDAVGCEVPCLDPGVASDTVHNLFQSLDDETTWVSQAAIVSGCDECIYGPVEKTLREFVYDLKSICCIEDSCLAGIINAILANPILNYRARFIEAQHAIAQVHAQNQSLQAGFAASQAAAQQANANICQIVQQVKQAIANIPQDGAQGSATRCCLAACLNNLCGQTAGAPIPPPLLPLPCPCPPISCEALEHACVVIKVSCASCNQAGAPVTCSEELLCNFYAPDGTPCDNAGGGITIAGVTYPARCLLNRDVPYKAAQGTSQFAGDKAVVLTFRSGRGCQTGFLGVVA